MTKIYKKSIAETSIGHARELYDKYLTFGRVFRDSNCISVPTIVGHDEAYLYFTYIDDIEIVREFYTQTNYDLERFYNIGDKLGLLHKSLRADSIEFIHGDMTPLNVSTHGDHVLFIDIEPPKSCNNFYYYYKNDTYVDLATFIFWTLVEGCRETDYIKTVARRYALARAFICGYTDSSGKVSKFKMLTFILRECKRFVCTVYNKRLR